MPANIGKQKSKPIIIKLGGSLIVPHLSNEGGLAVPFLKAFRLFLFKEVKRGGRFIIVAGGGKTCRVYQKAASQITKLTNEDIDWIGIHSTRFNAQFLMMVFQEEAYPWVIDRDPSFAKVRSLQASPKSIFFAAGWEPGKSTDHDAVRLAQKFNAHEIIKAGDIQFVYDKDPKRFVDAKPIRRLSWKEYRKLIPSSWSPGISFPIDPVASRLAQKLNLTAKILDGTNLANLKKAIEGRSFEGTVIF